MGSYDTATPPGVPWQVAPQGAIGNTDAGHHSSSTCGKSRPSCSTWQQLATGDPPSTSCAGSYDTTTPLGVPWQAAPQGAIANADAGHQLQVAHVANQGPSCTTWQQLATGDLPSTSFAGET